MIPGSADPKSSQAQPSWVVGPSIPAASRLGQVIEGEFLIKGVLGQGELGVTYEAENARLKRKFAVLMLKRELKPTHEMMLAVRNDLRRAQQLGAAGLMPVKMLADRDGIPGFATELLEGETLRARLNRGPLRAERALAIVVSVARTLEAAHKVGLVHGDLRPENIYLVRTTAKNASAGKVMVVEHGMHHLRRRAAGLDDRLPLYKHLYRPPEQVAGMIGATERGDVFVLGAILHECLTARPAFFAEEIEFILENLASPPPPLSASPATGLSRELAEALTLLIRQACALQLDERVPSMSELLEGIDQIVRGYSLKLPEPPVEAKDEVTLPAKAPTAESQSMSRLLQRMSGVFPQIALPPSGTPLTPPVESAPAEAGDGSAAGAAVRISSEAAASIPRLEPLQQERVSRILKRLSGAFPTIAPPAPEPDPTSAAPAPASAAPAVIGEGGSPGSVPSAAPAAAVAPSSAATPIPGLAGPSESAPAAVPVVTPESAITDPRVALPTLLPSSAATVGSAGVVAAPAPAAAPPVSQAPAARLPAPPSAEAPGQGRAQPIPAASAESAPAVVPLSSAAPAAPLPASPTGPTALAPMAASSGTGSPQASAEAERAEVQSAAAATAPAPASAGPAASPAAAGSSTTAERAAEQPITAPILPPGQFAPDASPALDDDLPPPPALPPTLVGAQLPLPSPGLALDRAAPGASGRPETPTRPRLEVSTELAVPPLSLGGAPAPLLPAPMILLPPPLSAPPLPPPAAGGIAPSLSPFASGAIPALPSAAQPSPPSPISSAPTAVQIPKPAALQRETTLAGDDLAEMLEPSQPAIPVPPPMPLSPASALPGAAGAAGAGPEAAGAASIGAAATKDGPRKPETDIGALRTVAQLEALPSPSLPAPPAPAATADAARSDGPPLAELVTRPALAALAERLAPLPPRINELPTQPAVRRLPITELATQARLAVSSDGIEGLSSSLLDDAPPSLPPTPAAGSPVTAPPTAETLVAGGRPAASGVAATTPSAGPAPSTAPAPVAPLASPSAITAPERPPTPRPPRVSQLIAALQNQQGPLKPAPEPEPSPAAVAPAPVGPKATGGQPRGLMAPSPEALAPLLSSETPALASAAHPARISPSPLPALVPPGASGSPLSRLIELALRHQELTAAALGAVLVLLITLLYLVVVR